MLPGPGAGIEIVRFRNPASSIAACGESSPASTRACKDGASSRNLRNAASADVPVGDSLVFLLCILLSVVLLCEAFWFPIGAPSGPAVALSSASKAVRSSLHMRLRVTIDVPSPAGPSRLSDVHTYGLSRAAGCQGRFIGFSCRGSMIGLIRHNWLSNWRIERLRR